MSNGFQRQAVYRLQELEEERAKLAQELLNSNRHAERIARQFNTAIDDVIDAAEMLGIREEAEPHLLALIDAFKLAILKATADSVRFFEAVRAAVQAEPGTFVDEGPWWLDGPKKHVYIPAVTVAFLRRFNPTQEDVDAGLAHVLSGYMNARSEEQGSPFDPEIWWYAGDDDLRVSIKLSEDLADPDESVFIGKLVRTVTTLYGYQTRNQDFALNHQVDRAIKFIGPERWDRIVQAFTSWGYDVTGEESEEEEE